MTKAANVDTNNPVEMPEWFNKRVSDIKGVTVGEVLDVVEGIPDTLQVLTFDGEGDTGESAIVIREVEGKVAVMDVGTKEVKDRVIVVGELKQALKKFGREEVLHAVDIYIMSASDLEGDDFKKSLDSLKEAAEEYGDKVFEPIVLAEPTTFGSRGMTVMSFGFHSIFSSWVEEDDTVDSVMDLAHVDRDEEWEGLVDGLRELAESDMKWRYTDYIELFWSPFGEGNYKVRDIS